MNVFRYITFRGALGLFLAFFVTAFLMPKFIAFFRIRGANQPISAFVPAHQNKAKTPTMGGIIFVGATIFASLLTAKLSNFFVWIGICTLLGFCIIGALDDFAKILAKKNAGLSARMKFFLLAVFSFGICVVLASLIDFNFYIPFMKSPILTNAPIFGVIFWIFVFLATTNAVNITDGLDGLATVPSIIAIFTLCIFVYIVGNFELSKYLLYPRVIDAGELFIVGMCLIGALFGFLWFNCNPAQIFMGDSGSLALGGFIAYLSIITNNEILLVLIGLIFVIETVSVILQITSYKTRKKRIFLMAPIHHHFEKKGWHENKIIIRFWIVALLSNLIALLSLKIR